MILDDVEFIVSKAKDSTSGYVETEKDWEVLTDLFKLWGQYYPKDYANFKGYMEALVTQNFHSKGLMKGKGEALVQHQLEIPEDWWRLVRAIYPKQRLSDKKFTKELSKRFAILKASPAQL